MLCITNRCCIKYMTIVERVMNS
ncbi:hypothetical protein Gotri_005219 [Gossypium trilobum]|uniref:Uncharacterized protein n=1 Tax=Gossypium trilobum TaxID=34281 RepID=A0A7J9EWS6_9ROSI|nr:hypothetical protein [Gossypium trilobum]